MISSMCCFNVLSSPKACWRLTRYCNLACKHCFAEAGHSGLRLPANFDELIKTLDELRARHVRHIVFSGGEPLIHSYLEPLIAAAVSYGIMPSVATNAIVATPSLCARLFTAGLRKATVSLDGPNREIYESIRNAPNTFTHVLRGIDALMKAGIYVSTNTVLQPYNLNSVEQIVNLAVSLGVETVAFTIPVCRGSGNPELLDFNDEARKIISETIRQVEKTISRHITLEVHDPRCLDMNCPAGKGIIGVDEFGRIVPCLVKEWVEAPSAIEFVSAIARV